ncbi:protease-4 [Elusimicrobium posterum]|uniref:signal peptide peptidase SppA n=1 Tax=Elusimicrobium posterum TaxID=3116653 RepID=UPI003C789F96
MSTETEKVGQSIFDTPPVNPAQETAPEQTQEAKPEENVQEVVPVIETPKAEEQKKEEPKDLKTAAAKNPPPPVKEEKAKKEGSPKGTNWLSILVLLFFVSSLSGLYLIFSNANTVKKDVFETGTKTSRPSLSTMTRNNASEGAVVIKIKGAIMESQSSSWRDASSASAIATRIRNAADRNEVKAIILDINSPGGTVAAVQDIYNAIMYARKTKNKKVVALFRDVAASGGYYIAMACDKIVAQPGTITGSIGVIFQTGNYEGLMEKIGVKFSNVKSGAHKDMGSPYRPMTQEEKTLLQEMIDDSYSQFFDVVKEGRPNINPVELKVYADGRIFTGRKAFSIGLVDALGGEAEALQIAGDLTGIKDIKVLSTLRASNFMEWLNNIDTEVSSAKKIENQLESITSPKMAYLWTL